MKYLILICAMAGSAACAPVSVQDLEQRAYQRVDYYQSEFLPLARACTEAGGFMVFEDPDRHSTRHADLSYGDMRLAVMRGCSGT